MLLSIDISWIFIAYFSVHSCNWYMGYRLHLCRGLDWEATFSWKKCCSPAGFDNWSSWNSFNGYNFSSMHFFDHFSINCIFNFQILYARAKLPHIFHFLYSSFRCETTRLGDTLQAWERSSQFLFLKNVQMLILWPFSSWRSCLLLIQRTVLLLKRFEMA